MADPWTPERDAALAADLGELVPEHDTYWDMPLPGWVAADWRDLRAAWLAAEARCAELHATVHAAEGRAGQLRLELDRAPWRTEIALVRDAEGRVRPEALTAAREEALGYLAAARDEAPHRGSRRPRVAGGEGDPMNLREALHALRVAGRIRSEWLPGMLLRDGPDDYMRVHAVDEAGPWLIDQDGDPLGVSAVIAVANWPLDLTDPATVGCLLALLREATGNRRWRVVPEGSLWFAELTPGPGDHYAGDTEGEAIAAALIAAAQGVERG